MRAPFVRNADTPDTSRKAFSTPSSLNRCSLELTCMVKILARAVRRRQVHQIHRLRRHLRIRRGRSTDDRLHHDRPIRKLHQFARPRLRDNLPLHRPPHQRLLESRIIPSLHRRMPGEARLRNRLAVHRRTTSPRRPRRCRWPNDQRGFESGRPAVLPPSHLA